MGSSYNFLEVQRKYVTVAKEIVLEGQDEEFTPPELIRWTLRQR